MSRDTIDAQSYFDSAAEHADESYLLYQTGKYALSHYVAGLAVECIFRAFIAKRRLIFDEKHDLRKLCYNSNFYSIVPKKNELEVTVALGQVVERWSNIHRFRSQRALTRFLKKRELDRGIRGDFVKENCRVIVSAASLIVNRGKIQWTLSR